MSCDRRTFLQRSAVGTGALALGLPVLQSCGNDVEVPPYIDATVVTDPASSRYGQVEVVLGRYPDLQAPGGAVTVRVAQPDGDHPFVVPTGGLLLLHLRATDVDPSVGHDHEGDIADQFVACDSECPHAGCPLGYNPGSGLIECPCHSSRFRAVADPSDAKSCGGDVVHRPAQSNLILYGLEHDPFRESLFIDLQTARACNTLPAPVDGVVTVGIDQLPALSQVGGFLVSRPAGFKDLLIVVRTSTTDFNVTSAICTHKRCTVGYDAGAMEIACPCHGSRYALSGAVVQEPATKPLTKYEASFDGVTLTILVA